MKASLFLLCILCTLAVEADEPPVVVDNRPEVGIPREARDQARAAGDGTVVGVGPRFRDLTDKTIKTVRIRYFNSKTWATEQAACDYVAKFLRDESAGCFTYQPWSQGVALPEIECIVEFTDEHRRKCLSESKECREGRLLIWETESCFRDASGKWWFVTVYDHFHRFHPNGDPSRAGSINKLEVLGGAEESK